MNYYYQILFQQVIHVFKSKPLSLFINQSIFPILNLYLDGIKEFVLHGFEIKNLQAVSEKQQLTFTVLTDTKEWFTTSEALIINLKRMSLTRLLPSLKIVLLMILHMRLFIIISLSMEGTSFLIVRFNVNLVYTYLNLKKN